MIVISEKFVARLRPATLTNIIIFTAVAIIASTGSGCIPVAWVTPPVELEVSVGPMMRQRAVRDVQEFEAAVPIRATILPLQLFPSQLSRSFDVGAGYQFMPIVTTQRIIHGPHLELAWLTGISQPDFLGWLIADGNRTRVGVHLKGHALFESTTGAFGPGATVQFSIDGFGFTDTDFDGCGSSQDPAERASDANPYRDDDEPRWSADDPDNESVFCGAGYAWGETSVGMYLETSYGRIDERDHWFVGMGFKLRVPASMGVGLLAGDL
jgi:hypothetical protein